MRVSPMTTPSAKYETPIAGKTPVRNQAMNGGSENFSRASAV